MEMTMTTKEKFFLGCLGALAPILINLPIVDYATTLSNMTVITTASYLARVLGLCVVGCLVVYLNADDEKINKRLTFFQLGVMGPALLTAMINGAASNVNAKSASLDLPSLFGTAFAQEGLDQAGSIQGTLNCNVRSDPTAGQQIIQGFFGILPTDRWFVVVSSNLNLEFALADVKQINSGYGGRFHAAICRPPVGTDNYYRVVIGQNLTYDQATKLKNEAAASGLPMEAWLWTPPIAVRVSP
jgi:hypothetical protein